MDFINKVLSVINELKKQNPIVLTDDEDREDEGDIVLPAQCVTPKHINFMITHCKGLICVPLHINRIKELKLHPMNHKNTDLYSTNFTVSVDGRGTGTGISAQNRSKTIKMLADPLYQESDFRRPGHIFPIACVKGGVLQRAGHTEASIDLMTLSGYRPASVICEIIREDGEMARKSDIKKFCKKFNLSQLSIRDLIQYQLHTNNTLIKREHEIIHQTRFGKRKFIYYSTDLNEYQHIAIIKGDIQNKKNILTRVHTENQIEDVFGISKFHSSDLLTQAMNIINQEKEGVFLYIRKPFKNNLSKEQKIKGNNHNMRNYGIGACILRDLGLTSLKLITNSEKHIYGISGFGLTITERIGFTIS